MMLTDCAWPHVWHVICNMEGNPNGLQGIGWGDEFEYDITEQAHEQIAQRTWGQAI
jgi:hypothetical protein